MKNRLFILITIAVVLLGAWWLLGGRTMRSNPSLGGKKSSSDSTAGQTSALPTNPTDPGTQPNTSAVTQAEIDSYLNSPDISPYVKDQIKANPSGAINRIRQFQQSFDAANGNSLDLYGKVVDQYGQPVPGAKIKADIMLMADFEHSKGEYYYTKTDAEGKFSFVGIHGVDLGILPQKDGYRYDLRLRADRPNNYFKADPSDPVVFMMWKIEETEPMIHTKLDSSIPYDGTPAIFDLYSGKKVNSGELKITLTRNPLQIERRSDHYDWNVQMEIIGGELVETNDIYKNRAPETGYSTVLNLGQSKDDSNWTQFLRKTFYVHTTKGYGRVYIELPTCSLLPAGTEIRVEAWLNPSGSRALDFDPAKQIKSK